VVGCGRKRPKRRPLQLLDHATASTAVLIKMAAAGDGDLTAEEGAVDCDGDVHGHFFCKKTFHRPTYCHHCTDMLWGLIGQGYMCEGRTTCMINTYLLSLSCYLKIGLYVIL